MAKIVLMGLPGAGKTTFLAALWHVVSNPDEIPSALTLGEMPRNCEYLNTISDEWLQYQPVPRTKISSEGKIWMKLQTRNLDASVELFFPDISGERFKSQIEDRHCTKEYVDSIRDTVGVLFFINTGDIHRPTRISDLTDFSNEIGLENNEAATENIITWNAELIPTQTKIVELLQILMNMADTRKYKLGIILSAWDLVKQFQITPKTFLDSRLPLVSQFLMANLEKFNLKVFGVSAQGGTMGTAEERKRLAEEYADCASRITILDEQSISNDLTLPIKWFL